MRSTRSCSRVVRTTTTTKDRQTIIQAKQAAESLIYRFERPDAEPLLWLPDAVAGAVSAAEAQERRYLDLLRERITTRRIVP